ncbi:MAG: Zn-dependent hydrolase [Betaproteobacteria bacterium]|nr:Zn-dependent hydrolase [Betaproteobacteria bacterium]
MAAVPIKKERPEEALLSYPFAEVPPLGTTMKVAEGIFWARMPLPFALDHINLWLIADTIDGQACWTLVDSGVGLEPTRNAWESIFANHLNDLPVKRVIITHAHPDHVGNAAWICERYAAAGCALTATVGEYFWAHIMSNGRISGFDNDTQTEHFRRHGLSGEMLDAISQNRKSYYATLVPAVPVSFLRMAAGDTLSIGGREWQVSVGYGHSNEHASLYCPSLKVLISGDMLLPRISTNIGVWPNEPESSPVRQFLAALAAYKVLPEDVLVLPSHGRLFRGAHERVRQLTAHHHERLAETLEACATPQSAADIIPVMFKRELDAHQTVFAVGETLAHLHYLRDDGKVAAATGADGIVRFTRA